MPITDKKSGPRFTQVASSSDSGRFLKVIQIFLVKVPNENAILEHSKNMHIDGIYLQFTGNTTV